MTDFDVVVLGQGGIGSAATYWASRRLGSSVLGLEQFEMGHHNGGSEDHSRIIRLSYHTPAYVELAKAAYTTWSELEEDSGQKVILRTGGLDLAPPGADIGLDAYESSMDAAGVPFERLSADDVMKRWPQWRLPEEVSALYQPESGIAKAYVANSTHRRMAEAHGATLIEGTKVTALQEDGGEIVVTCGEGTYTAGKLIIAAGAWTNESLAQFGVHLPLEVTQEQVVYLRPTKTEDFMPDRFPIWIWMDVPSFYGFPVFGEDAVKVAWDRCELVTDAAKRSHTPLPEVTEQIRGFTARYLPGSDTGVHLARTCLYTLTPDRDFVIDRVPGTRNVFCAIGAGHAFKFASLIGRILVELALDGSTEHDISAFSADRNILNDPNPTRNYLV